MKHPRIAGLLRRVARQLDPQPQIITLPPITLDGRELARAVATEALRRRNSGTY